MSKVTKISAWLSLPDQERDYFTGIALYQEFGDNPRLKSLVFVRENNFPANKKNLAYELTKLIAGVKLPPKRSKIDKSESAKVSRPTLPPKDAIVVDKVTTKKVLTNNQSLRKEFPKLVFEELPDSLKILVVNKGILFNKAKEAREKLEQATTDQERLKWNKILTDSMLENQQIWDELNYFQSHKKVLGKHPSFSQAKELEKLKAMTTKQLIQKQRNIPTYISKANKAIKENPKDEKILKAKRAIIQKYEWMNTEIDKLMADK